jgi:hypothetical protein
MTKRERGYKQTPERVERLLKALRAGNTRRASCAYAGITDDTLSNWCKKSDFSDMVQKAESEAEMRNVQVIMKAAEKSWQAAAWWLERRRREDYSTMQNLRHGTDPDAPMTITIRHVGPEGPPYDGGQ